MMMEAAMLGSLRAVETDAPQSIQQSALITHGEYKIYPMQCYSEEDVAQLFVKTCQRGNPVLQGRPFEDLEVLGRAMYRKSAKLAMGQVTVHNGKLVGLGCCWDVAEGGVWQNSGLEMPASLAAHAAIGKKCFDSLPSRDRKTLFCAFYGVLPPHSANCFAIMVISNIAMSHQMGFEDTFQFTLLTSLKGRGVFSDSSSNDDSLNWQFKFTDVASEKPEVLDELKELGGSISLQLNTNEFNLGDKYMAMAATTGKLKTADELRQLVQVTAANHMEWLASSAVVESHGHGAGRLQPNSCASPSNALDIFAGCSLDQAIILSRQYMIKSRL
jgi:hypothetical protein